MDMDTLRAVCDRLGLDLAHELELLQEQGDEWGVQRAEELARQLRDSHGVDAVIEAIYEIAPIIGFNNLLPEEEIRINIAAL